MVAGEVDQFLSLRNHDAALRRADDSDAAATPELEQPFVPEQVQRAQHCVLVHAKDRCEVLGQRQPFSWAGFAIGYRTPDLRCNLVVQWDRSRPVNVDIQHGTSDSRTMLEATQQPERGTLTRDAVADGWSPSVPAALAHEVRALFREARRRRIRRRLVGLVVVLLAAILAAGSAVTWLHRGLHEQPPGGQGAAAAPTDQGPASVVWVDDGSRLHIGEIGAEGGLSERVIGEVNAASEPLVAAGRRVYWVDPAGTFVPSLGHWSQVVQVLNLDTRRITLAGAGQTVFLSADHRSLLTSQWPTSLTESPVAGGQPRVFNLPRGWYLPGGDGLADPLSGQGVDTANGILVQSKESPGIGPRRIALWSPRTGAIEVIGRARAVIDAYTPPGALYSMLAWLPAGCAPPGSCLVKITDTASLAVTTVHSQTRGGFAFGGAFSPDGRSLAVFANTQSGRSTRLALIDLATGELRIARMRAMPLGLDYGWARWLPGGTRLIAGTLTGYVIDAATLSARPLHARNQSSTAAINYTAVVISR